MLETLGAAYLTLDLLTGPAGGVNCPRLEVSVLAGLLDHRGKPFGAVEVGKVAIGECLGNVTVIVSKFRMTW